jgi:hypothetical protein
MVLGEVITGVVRDELSKAIDQWLRNEVSVRRGTLSSGRTNRRDHICGVATGPLRSCAGLPYYGSLPSASRA